MNLQGLRYAVEVERAGSISQAAENMFMNQPHLSKAIRDLEKEMGFAIFKRISRGIVPTDEGEEFLKYAKEVLAKVAVLEQLREKNKGRQLALSVASVRTGYARDAFAGFMAKQSRNEEGFLYLFEEMTAKSVIDRVVEKKNAMGITRYPSVYGSYYQKLLKEKNLTVVPLAAFQYVVWMAKRHPEAKKQDMTYLDLMAYTEIVYGEDGMMTFELGENQEEKKKRICVKDRDTAHELLKRVPGTYMWDAPANIPDPELVQKVCSRPGNLYEDVVIFSKERRNDMEEQMLEYLKMEARKLGKGY